MEILYFLASISIIGVVVLLNVAITLLWWMLIKEKAWDVLLPMIIMTLVILFCYLKLVYEVLKLTIN